MISNWRKTVLGVATLLSLAFLILWFPQLRIRSLQPGSKLVFDHDTQSHDPQLAADIVTNIETQSYNGVILYLVQSSRVSELLDSLASVKDNLALRYPWPILLFHTGDFDEESSRDDFIARLRGHLGGGKEVWAFGDRIEFVKLDWRLPEGIPQDKDVLNPVDANRWPGYHHMCAFFSVDIFSNPRLKDVTYYMRLDTDSLILEPLCYDPFELTHIHDMTYGYLAEGNDAVQVTIGLWDFLSNYSSTHPSVERKLKENGVEWPERDGNGVMGAPFKGYYTNFEMVRLEAFRRSDVSEWLEALKAYPEGFFKWRWGDAPLRWATVKMFFDVKKDTELMCGMRYDHQSLRLRLASVYRHSCRFLG